MSSFNMSYSSIEEGVPLALTHPSEFVGDIQKSLVTDLEFKKQSYESTTNTISDYLRSSKENISQMKDVIERLTNRKSEVSSALIEIKLLSEELIMKRKALKETAVTEQVTQEELHSLLQRVVNIEQENKLKIDDLKKTKRNLVGQMCFYKTYLDIYVDKIDEEEYILYFRRCKKEDDKKPNEWIRIKTPDFKSYSLCDVSLPEGSKERNDIINLSESGTPLRRLIVEARKACLSYN